MKISELENWGTKLSNLADLSCRQKKIGVNSLHFLMKTKFDALDSSFFRLFFTLETIGKLSKANAFFTKKELIEILNYFVKNEEKKGIFHKFMIDTKEDYLFQANTVDSVYQAEMSKKTGVDFSMPSYKIDIKKFYVLKESDFVENGSYEKISNTAFYREKLSDFDSFIRENDKVPQHEDLDIENRNRFIVFNIKNYESLINKNKHMPYNFAKKDVCYISRKTINKIRKIKKSEKKEIMKIVKNGVVLKKLDKKQKDDYELDVLNSFFSVKELNALWDRADCKKTISEIKNLPDKELEALILARDGNSFSHSVISHKKDFNSLIKNHLFFYLESRFEDLYEELIISLFERLSSEVNFYIYKEDSFFKKGFFKTLTTKDPHVFFEYYKMKKVYFSINYKNAVDKKNMGCRSYYHGNKVIKFKSKIKELSEENKELIVRSIFEDKDEFSKHFLMKKDAPLLTSLFENCSEEDRDLLELNYEETSEPLYEIFFKQNQMLGSIEYSKINLIDIQEFIENINDIGVMLNFNLETFIVRNLHLLSID